MSERTRNSREIRIVPGSSNPPAAAAPTVAPSAVQIFRSLAAQASALASVIGPAPDELQTPQPDASYPAGSGETRPPRDTAAGLAEPSAHEGGAADHDDKPAVAMSRLAAAASRPAQRSSECSEEAALGEHIVRACATAAHGEVLAQQLADRVARFCSMSGASDDAVWEVTLPMNPAVLDDTLLHLQLSPSRMALRFETASTRSAQLIYDNADKLRVRLSDALHRQIDVDVVV
jgi:Type III secretion protein (HpaP)